MQAIIVALALFAGTPGQAGATAGNGTYEAELLAELGQAAPGAVPDGRAASDAYVAGRWEEAIAAYQRVLAKAPGFSHALRRICNAQVELERFGAAVGSCRAAVALAPISENRMSLALALASGPENPAARTEAGKLGREALSGHPGERVAQGVCQVALRAGDWDLLSACVQSLQATAPAAWETHYYASAAAYAHAHFDLAEAELQAARAAGLDGATADSLRDAIRKTRASLESGEDPAPEPESASADRPLRPGPLALVVLGSWAAGFVVLIALGAVLSAATSRAARRLAQSPAGTDSAGARGLRRIYRAVLWVTCAYYYASIPIVLAVVLAAGGGFLWLVLQADRVPIKLLLIVAFLVFVTVWAALKSLYVSLFRTGGKEDPGERVRPGEHPELERLVKAVAARVKTRPVDAIFLTPGAEVAVFERGGMMRQLAGRAERCLIVGVGVLEGMSRGELEAVLAHEYGHFVNRDTAGGGFALAVRRSVLTMARALGEGGAATWYNPAWWFVRGFHKVFLRVSQGASRLQEILADRWAALLYGGGTFARGLEHAIAQGVRFDAHTQRTLREVIEGERGLSNLYRYQPAQGVDEQELQAAVAEAMNAEPTPYDSHPAPRDRIAWTAALPGRSAGIDAASPAWSLFSDREAVERAMTLRIKRAVAANHGVEIPDEPADAAAAGQP